MAKRNNHDLFVRKVLQDSPQFRLDLFKALLRPSQYILFKWESLKVTPRSFVDKANRERRTDIPKFYPQNGHYTNSAEVSI